MGASTGSDPGRPSASELAHQAYHDALNLDFGGRDPDRFHVRVGWLQPDLITFRVVAFERCFNPHQSHHHLAGYGALTTQNDHEVTIVDAFLDHRFSRDPQDIVVRRLAAEQVVGHRQLLTLRQRFDRLAGGDNAEKRNLSTRRNLHPRNRPNQLEPTLLIPIAMQIALLLKQLQMLVHRPERRVPEFVTNFAVGRRNSMALLVLGDEFENRLLTFGEISGLPSAEVAVHVCAQFFLALAGVFSKRKVDGYTENDAPEDDCARAVRPQRSTHTEACRKTTVLSDDYGRKLSVSQVGLKLDTPHAGSYTRRSLRAPLEFSFRRAIFSTQLEVAMTRISIPRAIGSDPISTDSGALAGSLAAVDLERHELSNGLQVVLHRDTTLPLVALNLWYHVGSKNEGPGRTGFAHLFEHLLFQGSENVGTNDHFRYIQQAGGVANGSTWYDRTNYYEVLPTHYLDLGLWLESDRMGRFLPAITQEKLDNQREVVINERRQKMDNQPYGRAFERLHELLYPEGHPYRWPVIGYIEDLTAATLDDVQKFFETFYVPRNTVLTLAGDIDYDQALGRIEHFFGDIPAGEPVSPPQAPAARIDRERREVQSDEVLLPRIYMAFNAPAYGEPGWYAADMLSTALSEGKSSLMFEDLVYRRQLAQDVGCYIFPTEITATFAVITTAKPGVDPEELEAAVDEHLARAGKELLSEDHFERALNQRLTDHYSQLQTLDRRADHLSLFTTYFDDPSGIFREVERFGAVTREAVREFAAESLRPDRRAVVTVVPREKVVETAGRGSQ